MVRQLRFVPALDGIRCFAVASVLVYHSYVYLIPKGNILKDPVYSPVPGAFLGVDMFFALSGFLITSLLLGEASRSGRIRFGAFYLRRARRLFPALLTMVVIVMYFLFVTSDLKGVTLAGVGSVLFYFSNWMESYGHGVPVSLSHTWSLAIEEQFYLVWPLVIAFVIPAKRKLFVAVSLLVGVSLALDLNTARLYAGYGSIASWHLYQRTDTRVTAILMGALCGYVWCRRPEWFKRKAVVRFLRVGAWLSVAFLAYAIHQFGPDRRFYYVGGFTAVGLATGVIILATVEHVWFGNRVLNLLPIRAVGRVSYGLYLWSVPVFVAVARYGTTWSIGVRVVVAFSVTAAITTASWFLIERPFLARPRTRRTDTAPPAQSPSAHQAPLSL